MGMPLDKCYERWNSMTVLSKLTKVNNIYESKHHEKKKNKLNKENHSDF